MSKSAHIATAVLALAAAALVAAGCGGGGDSSTDASTIAASTLSKAEFLKQANAICKRGRSENFKDFATYIQSHPAKTGESPGEQFAKGVQATLLPNIESQIAQIRELGAPAGDVDQVETFLDTLQEKVDVVKRLHNVASRFPIDRIFRPAGDLARAYGLDYCGYGEGPS